MRNGDSTALAAIALGAATSIALTAILLVGLPTRTEVRTAPPAPRDAVIRFESVESFENDGAFGFRPPIDFAVIRIPGRLMSGPESEATGWHHLPGPAPHAPDRRRP